jgi:succinyl-CoA synthetase beta subunit
MKIHEYQAKELFRKTMSPFPKAAVAFTPVEARPKPPKNWGPSPLWSKPRFMPAAGAKAAA